MTAARFILPSRIAVQRAARGECSYAITNYYGHGPVASAKRHRFQRALELARGIPAKNVIDMGTGDGVFLPTLSQNYEHVVGLDSNEEYIKRAQRLVDFLKIDNVELICARDLSFQDLRQRIGPDFKLMFLLETLEHVGSQPDVWASKLQFLNDCFSLLQDDGRIIVTVPKMVGFFLLIKNLIQRLSGRGYDAMSFRQLLRSALLKDTGELEPLWNGGHVGFNHLKLEPYLEKHFVIHHRSESLISVFYVLGSKSEGAA